MICLFLFLSTSNKIKNESKDQFNNVVGLYIVGLRVLCTNLAKLELSIHAPDPITY